MTANIAGYDVNFRRIVGRGAIGLVYLATDKDGTKIAAKQVDETRSEKKAVRELENAQKHSLLNHQNIVKILHICNEKETGELWIFMEYLSGGDLNNFFINHYTEFQAMKVDLMIQMSRGLHFLHGSKNGPKICHRDIKPENILIHNIQSEGRSELLVVRTTFWRGFLCRQEPS